MSVPPCCRSVVCDGAMCGGSWTGMRPGSSCRRPPSPAHGVVMTGQRQWMLYIILCCRAWQTVVPLKGTWLSSSMVGAFRSWRGSGCQGVVPAAGHPPLPAMHCLHQRAIQGHQGAPHLQSQSVSQSFLGMPERGYPLLPQRRWGAQRAGTACGGNKHVSLRLFSIDCMQTSAQQAL